MALSGNSTSRRSFVKTIVSKRGRVSFAAPRDPSARRPGGKTDISHKHFQQGELRLRLSAPAASAGCTSMSFETGHRVPCYCDVDSSHWTEARSAG